MDNEDGVPPESFADNGYTAFEKQPYRQVLYPTDQVQSWRDMGNSYFAACRPLVAALARGELNEDMEGTAAIYLFRHYLELMLKRIVLSGRLLISDNEIARREEIQNVANTHNLDKIWKWVLADAKPKLKEWDNYDIASLEQCVMEFDRADKRGVAFRYDREGGEHCRFDFPALDAQMDHLRQVLEGVWTCLYETRAEIQEYEADLQAEFGSDMYW
ncbi:MAG TPA: hypothetical protein VNV41_16515 [Candidatus Acidoferrales bacterium]|jgi:hypothetical protein|nr:hypothetical protein [Candidatus Acidoferrales bacterium]